VHAKNSASLAHIQRFLATHPKYGQLIQALKELPKHLLPKGRLVPVVNSGVANAAARHFRKTFSLPYDKWNSSKYYSTIGRQLNGKISYFKGLGKHATWYIPAAIGIYNVATAPQEQKVKTLFEQGFSVLGGYFGTLLGAQVISVGAIGVLSLCGLCLGPLGIFVVVFLCAAAGGIAGSMGGEFFGGLTYDFGKDVHGRVFHTPEELFGVF